MNKKSIPVLALIILVAGTLRVYQLGEVPVGFHRDEAFLGYNAYSILKTGKSMSGDFLPLHLQSFLYSPAGYSYASIPFIAVFGLTSFSVRAASAFYGVLTVVATYFLVKELFMLKLSSSVNKMTATLSRSVQAEYIALVSAGLLALLPWHINLSRTATENSIVTFCIVTGIWLYLLWTRRIRNSGDHLLYLLGSFAFFGVTFGLYQAPRAFLPIFIPVIVVLFTPKRVIHRIFVGVLYMLVVIAPLAFVMTNQNLSLRIKTVSLFASGEVQLLVDEQIREDGVQHVPPLMARANHNKLYGYVDAFLQNYAAHFSYPFLMTDAGFPDRYRVPGSGLLYLFIVPLFIFGLWDVINKHKKIGALLSGWILLVPVGSSLAFDDVPNLQRTLMSTPVYAIMASYGLVSFYALVHLTKWKVVLGIASAGIVTASVMSYLHNYYVNQIIHVPIYRNEGYKQLVAEVNSYLPAYEKAIITNSESAPAIFFLFYNSYDPFLFQKQSAVSAVRDYDRMHFGLYEFSTEQCPLRIDAESGTLTGTRGILYINHGVCDANTTGVESIKTIKRSDETHVFRIVEVE